SPFFDKEKLAMIDEACAIDTVITHTSPSFCELSSHQGLHDWAMRDEDLLDNVKHERKVMDSLYTHLRERGHPLCRWYYTHFHQSWHADIDGVMFNMLDIMELKEITPPPPSQPFSHPSAPR
ncbi:MAG: hypothetical protein K5890_02935, partial [Bacteroidales bacterium]|nr:hypothetical protein [Bacteroidales bacterium]